MLSLADARGVLERVVQAFARRQRLPRGRYEFIAAGEADAEARDILARYLAPGEFHVAPDASEIATQWREGAAVARGRWLVFSEGHTIPAPGYLTEILRRAEETRADVLGIASPGSTRSALEWMDEHFVSGELAVRSETSQAVCGRGFAVRRAVYEAEGGFESGVGSYCVPLFAAALERRGVAVAVAERAVVMHQNIRSLDTPSYCVGDYMSGLHTWRRRVPEPVAWELMGVARDWCRRGDAAPHHARAATRALLRIAARDSTSLQPMPSPRGVLQAIVGALSLVPRCLVTPGMRARVASRRAQRSRRRLSRATRDAAGIEVFIGHWRTLAAAELQRQLATSEGAPETPRSGESVVVSSGHLFGLSPPRREGDRWLRRIGGVAGIELPEGLEPREIEVRLDPASRQCGLVACWDDRVLGRIEPGARQARFVLPVERTRKQSRPTLVLIEATRPRPRWRRKFDDEDGIVWLETLLHDAGGERKFVISPWATAAADRREPCILRSSPPLGSVAHVGAVASAAVRSG